MGASMEIRTDVTLPFPRERVFVAYRDRLPELLRYLPNIRGVEVRTREEREGEVYLVNAWKGGGEIPSAARAVLRESMLSWTDHATWRAAELVCAWRTEVHAFPGALRSSGTNRFVELPEGRTRIEFRGDLVCDASHVPGVPKLLARGLNGTIEKLFVGKIAENLTAVGQGLGKLLAEG
jgi:hypothetical protein